MYCKQCSNELAADAKFCNKCAFPVAELVLPASTLKRFTNYFIDTVVVVGLTWLFAFSRSFLSEVPSIILSLLSIFILFGYYFVCESLWQQTLGKLITKTKVVNRNGFAPSALKTLGRSFARYIPFESLSFLFGGYPIGWHDSLSKTLVVREDMTPEEVRSMDFIEIKNQKGKNTSAVVIIIIVVVVIIVAIVGILASVVLVSLSDAREKSGEAMIRANATRISVTAESYNYDNNDSYLGLCNDEKILDLLKLTSIAGDKNKNENNYVCNDSTKNYAISVPLKTGGYWCVDDLSRNQKSDKPLGAALSCLPTE